MIAGTVIAAAVLFYVTTAGFVGGRVHSRVTNACEDCQRGYACYKDHASLAFFIGAPWPLALPLCFGVIFGSRDASTRLRIQRETELAKAEHDAQVAAVRRKEAEQLSRELRALGVDR